MKTEINKGDRVEVIDGRGLGVSEGVRGTVHRGSLVNFDSVEDRFMCLIDGDDKPVNMPVSQFKLI